MSSHSITGLDFLQAMVDGTVSPPSIAATMGMTAKAVEAGRMVYEVKADDRHENPLGGTHGGFAATILDSVTGCAVHSMLKAGEGYGTVDLNVKMMRPVPKHVELIAEGNIINISKSLGISEGTLKDKNGKLYAHATATCMIIRP